MMRTIKKIALGQGVTTLAIMLSCSGQPEKMGHLGGPGGQEGVAQAAPAEGGSGGASQPTMPKNPSHITFQFPLVSNVKVGFASVNSYPVEITDDGVSTFVTVFIPQGVQISISLDPKDKDGNSIGEPIMHTVIPKAKLGTYRIAIGETDQEIEFDDSVQKALQVGENVLDAPSNEQFIGGSTCAVRHSVYKAEFDQVCHMSWMGAEELRIFRNGPAECHKVGDVNFPLDKGEEVGVYPVTQGSQLNSGPTHLVVEAIPREE